MQIHLDIEPVQLGYPVDIGDRDVVHLEPAVHAGTAYSQFRGHGQEDLV